MIVDNCTAIGVVYTTMKQRQSKVFDKNKDWLRDRMIRGQFDYHSGDGKSNLTDMPTKFYPPQHYRRTQPCYQFVEGKTPHTLSECTQILRQAHTPKQQMHMQGCARMKIQANIIKIFKRYTHILMQHT